eukprot:1399601-Lingulodinium_polyedra.AAC.1
MALDMDGFHPLAKILHTERRLFHRLFPRAGRRWQTNTESRWWRYECAPAGRRRGSRRLRWLGA